MSASGRTGGRDGPGGPAPAEPSAPAPRRRGRPAKTARSDARDRIVTAARAEFGAHGYDRTSVRSIAKSAGVDPALVHHYFGTKDGVFQAAIESAFAPALLPETAALAGAEGIGERLVRLFLGVWEDPATREPLLVIVRSALTAEPAAAALREFVLRELLLRVASELEVPEPRLRAELAASHMVGLMILRYVLKVEPLASADTETLVSIIAPTIQRYLTEP